MLIRLLNKKKIIIVISILAIILLGFFTKRQSVSITEIKDIQNKQESIHIASIDIEGSILGGEVKDGESVYDFMDRLRSEGKVSFKEKNYSGIGKFIEEINGVRGENGKYWIYYVNGKKMSLGVSSVKIKTGDVVSWKYEKEIN